ncbi:MAG TPA: site-2 protease family protein [Flavisolibacter sp.]|nr:site-2 protease family protein [Flavisolibacter sp.]
MKDKLKHPLHYLLLLVLVLAAKASVAQTLLRIFPQNDKPGAFVFISLLILALFAALAVHELGHLLTGIFQGFRFELFVVGPLGIKRTDKGVRIYFNKNLGFWGGVAATVPIRQNPRNKQKFAWLILAGPLASLLFSLLSFFAFSISLSGAARVFWLISGAASVGIFLATTLPSKSGMFFTDRARFQRLISKGKEGQSEEALLSILAQTMIDTNCKHISIDQTQLLQNDSDQLMRFWGYYYEFHYYKDNTLLEEAAQVRSALLSYKGSIPSTLWKALKMDETLATPASPNE